LKVRPAAVSCPVGLGLLGHSFYLVYLVHRHIKHCKDTTATLTSLSLSHRSIDVYASKNTREHLRTASRPLHSHKWQSKRMETLQLPQYLVSMQACTWLLINQNARAMLT